MAVRIAFDMDGVLADFASAFREVEHRLFGPVSDMAVEPPEVEARHEENPEPGPVVAPPSASELKRRRAAIWEAIHETPDFWAALKPLDVTAVGRIHQLMIRRRWEVFFITQRPATAGETVQRQTQKWLCQQGFDLPSVLVIGGSRGEAAAALRLTYHVDDNPQNCLDVTADSDARAILVLPERDELTEKSMRRLRIGVVRSVGDALDILERLPESGGDPGLLDRLSRLVGWR